MRAIFIVLLLSFIISCERVEMISEHKTIDKYASQQLKAMAERIHPEAVVMRP